MKILVSTLHSLINSIWTGEIRILIKPLKEKLRRKYMYLMSEWQGLFKYKACRNRITKEKINGFDYIKILTYLFKKKSKLKGKCQTEQRGELPLM